MSRKIPRRSPSSIGLTIRGSRREVADTVIAISACDAEWRELERISRAAATPSRPGVWDDVPMALAIGGAGAIVWFTILWLVGVI